MQAIVDVLGHAQVSEPDSYICAPVAQSNSDSGAAILESVDLAAEPLASRVEDQHVQQQQHENV